MNTNELIELLEKVKVQILEHPEQFDMSEWSTEFANAYEFSESKKERAEIAAKMIDKYIFYELKTP